MNKIDAAKFTHIDATTTAPPSLVESEQRCSSSTWSGDVVAAAAVDPQVQQQQSRDAEAVAQGAEMRRQLSLSTRQPVLFEEL